MLARHLSSAAVAVIVIASTVACAPTPEPDAPEPMFSSEAEAFAAAEQTYRSYVDALNSVVLSDPETFEAVYAWTTGEANSAERESLSQMHANRWAVSGATYIETIYARDHDEASGRVSFEACTDVSSINLVDSEGVSQVSEDRPNRQSTVVHLVPADSTPTLLQIDSIAGGDQPCD